MQIKLFDKFYPIVIILLLTACGGGDDDNQNGISSTQEQRTENNPPTNTTMNEQAFAEKASALVMREVLFNGPLNMLSNGMYDIIQKGKKCTSGSYTVDTNNQKILFNNCLGIFDAEILAQGEVYLSNNNTTYDFKNLNLSTQDSKEKQTVNGKLNITETDQAVQYQTDQLELSGYNTKSGSINTNPVTYHFKDTELTWKKISTGKAQVSIKGNLESTSADTGPINISFTNVERPFELKFDPDQPLTTYIPPEPGIGAMHIKDLIKYEPFLITVYDYKTLNLQNNGNVNTDSLFAKATLGFMPYNICGPNYFFERPVNESSNPPKDTGTSPTNPNIIFSPPDSSGPPGSITLPPKDNTTTTTTAPKQPIIVTPSSDTSAVKALAFCWRSTSNKNNWFCDGKTQRNSGSYPLKEALSTAGCPNAVLAIPGEITLRHKTITSIGSKTGNLYDCQMNLANGDQSALTFNRNIRLFWDTIPKQL